MIYIPLIILATTAALAVLPRFHKLLSAGLVLSGLALFYTGNYYATSAITKGYALSLIAMGLLAVRFIRELDNYTAPLVALAGIGGMLVSVSDNLLGVVAGLEAAAISLAGLYAKSSDEASIKYYYSVMFSSPLLVLALSLIYVASGNLSLESLNNTSNYTLVALVLLVAGLAVDVGLAPFHFWVPDVFEKASPVAIAVALLLADIPVLTFFFKITEIASIIGTPLFAVISLLSLLSILIGGLSALTQRNPRRLIGYDSICDAGFAGLLAAAFLYTRTTSLWPAVLFIVSSNMSIALFLAAYDDEKGVGPVALAALASLMGLPPLAGFTAKVSILGVLFESSYFLGILASLAFVLIAGYLARLAIQLWRPAKLQAKPLFVYIVYISLLVILGVNPMSILGGM